MTQAYPLLTNFKGQFELRHGAGDPALVKEIQSLLKLGGFLQGTIDGQVGPLTLEAFASFKHHAYLEYASLVGLTTAQALLEIEGLAIHPKVDDRLPLAISEKTIRLPGNELVDVGDFIHGCRHFRWGEATAGGTRIPASRAIVANIIRAGQYLESVRDCLGGRAIQITSWHRPPKINSQVGGVSNSTHIPGHGIDFRVAGIPPLAVYARLHEWHGSRGGLGRSSQFTHLDLRGYQARWHYG